MMDADRLDQLADEATPGPGGIGTPQARVALIELAPSLAREHAALLRWAEAAGTALELMLDLSGRLYRDPDRVGYEEKRLRDDNARAVLNALRSMPVQSTRETVCSDDSGLSS